MAAAMRRPRRSPGNWNLCARRHQMISNWQSPYSAGPDCKSMKGRMISLALLTLSAFLGSALDTYSQKQMEDQPIIIAASTVLDGKGRVLHNTRIVVRGGKIVR